MIAFDITSYHIHRQRRLASSRKDLDGGKNAPKNSELGSAVESEENQRRLE